ncbi:eukaryotic translation initiation factor 2c [Colletotrichum truncatum]|uniref:Eukaryotic translation initiation factor 2c n=1 Tax=Colletotrichum truncatum TaxID=5467 RepID=A0ACC3Z676_COLTU|nr:eukaryotic translation initiation factor 2c [Colletotrichum truncatum]KAF6787144.1 eukaryotic translation initiation factor 2c [Colletotrichum truncatum]
MSGRTQQLRASSMNMDGSNDGRSSSRGPGSPGRSRSGSQSSQRHNPFGPSLGFDPAKPEGPGPSENHVNTRLDLPAEAYCKNAGETSFARRPGYNTAGKPCNLEINQFRVKSWNDKMTIYQYDVLITPPPLKYNVVFQKCWKHPAVQAMLQKYKCLWLSDGRRLAWAPVAINRGEERIMVDLDEGLPPPKSGKPRRDNSFKLILRQTKPIHLAALEAYLKGQMDWDNTVLESMNFLDHLVRQYPSERLLQIKRNFYNERAKKSMDLGPFLELVKGVYASVRMNQSVSNGIGRGLGLNVDIANTAFWKGGSPLHLLVRDFLAICDKNWRNLQPESIASLLKPIRQTDKNGSTTFAMSDAFKHLRRLAKLRFTPKHRGKENWDKVYLIKSIAFGAEHGEKGATAENVKFMNNGEEVNVVEYFKKTYGYRVQFPTWPLVETQKSGFFPMEVCIIKPMQRYTYKLDPDQTAAMIKGAVTRPNQRKAEIIDAKNQLAWREDPYLRQYGVVFDDQMAKTTGSILEPPKIQYANNVTSPMFSGRWDLRGKKFWISNRQPLQSWGIVILENSTNKPAATQFAQMFKQTYTGHGGKVIKDAVVVDSEMRNNNMADAVAKAYKTVQKATGLTPQLIFCILRFNNTGSYERIKKSADCRFGVLTQCVLSRHVEKNQAQYHSNVAMKVNAKLGGITCRIPHPSGPNSKAPAFFKEVTMMIGADVSHGTPGIDAPSMATMTMSMDQDATFYSAAADTNGYRVEILKPLNIRNFLARLMPTWHKRMNHPAPPPHLIYLRDGVSEGQYSQVLEYEVGSIKALFKEKYPGAKQPKFTVIVATKRHHIRFFPQQGDKNNNPLPGTLLEKEVCHPFWWDFYLCSHVAIQGTARPVHYTVLMDEAKMSANDLQKMIYGQCYQYARSTTPVSLHPAIYYADLAAGRARAHENIATSHGFRSGPKAAEMVEEYGARGQSMFEGERPTESLPLLPLGGSPGEADPASSEMFRNTMWYI